MQIGGLLAAESLDGFTGDNLSHLGCKPPGYSKGKRFAVARLTVSWSEHHGDAICLLENVDGRGFCSYEIFIWTLESVQAPLKF